MRQRGPPKCACKTWNSVRYGTTVKLNDLLAVCASNLWRRELCVVHALLAADKGELSVWREAECWLWILGEVIRDVTHAGLLVVTNDGTQGVRKLLASLFDLLNKVVSCPEGEGQRTLVVQNAATQNKSPRDG